MHGSQREHEAQSRRARGIVAYAGQSKPEGVAAAIVLIAIQVSERKSREPDECDKLR